MAGPAGPGFANDVRMLVTRGFQLNPAPDSAGPSYFISFVTRRGFSQPFTETGQSGAEIVRDFPVRFWETYPETVYLGDEIVMTMTFDGDFVARVRFDR